MTEPQGRLLQPPRLERFCPADCTCAPCQPWCEFCKARKKLGRKTKGPVHFETGTNFEHRQLHLFGGRLERKQS
jgi:hypothetical protein